MSIWSRFIDWVNGTAEDETYRLEAGIATSIADSANALDLQLLMIQSALGYLATGLSMCRWRLIDRGNEVKNEEYYRLNNCPNPNQSKAEFCAKLVHRLAMKNEAIVFSPDGKNLYIADTWQVEDKGEKVATYYDVTVQNSNRSWRFKATDVMHLRMNWVGITPLLMSVAAEYEKMITTAYNGYQKQTGTKGVLSIGAVAAGTPEQMEAEFSRIRKRLATFYDATSAVLPLTKGQEYTPIATANRNTSEINDVQTLTDEFSERLGLALRIPVSLLKGNNENTEHARADLIMYGIKPIAQMFEQEYNAKRLGMPELLRGSRLFIDPLPIQLSNMESLANFCERMTSCGQYSIDELRELRGEPLLGTEEATTHYITKNYGVLGAEEGAENGPVTEQ